MSNPAGVSSSPRDWGGLSKPVEEASLTFKASLEEPKMHRPITCSSLRTRAQPEDASALSRRALLHLVAGCLAASALPRGASAQDTQPAARQARVATGLLANLQSPAWLGCVGVVF